MYKKYLIHLSNLSDIKLFAARYAANFIVLLEIVLLPILLSSSFYTDVEILRQIFLLIPVFILGANSGFLYSFYTDKQDYSTALLLFSTVMGIVAGIVFGVLLGSVGVALVLMFLTFTYGLEKILVLNNKLIAASLYKSFCSVITIFLAVFLMYSNIDFEPMTFYTLAISVGMVFWFGFIVFSKTITFPSLKQCSISWSDFLSGVSGLIKKGFFLASYSYIFLLYLILDRQTIANNYPEYLAEYTIAFSLSQVVFIAINTVAFSAQRKVGVEIDSFGKKEYSLSIKRTVFLFLGIYIAAAPFVYLFSMFVSGYGDFFFSYLLIAFLVGVFYTLSSFSVLAFYKGWVFAKLFLLLAILLYNYLYNHVGLGYTLSYYGYLIQSGLILITSALVIDIMLRAKLKNV